MNIGRIKNIVVLNQIPTQGLGNDTKTSEAKYSINSTESGKRFMLNLHYNGSNR